MADRTISELDAVSINSLPVAPDIYDNSLLVTEQQGEARKITGRQWKDYAISAVASETDKAIGAVEDAEAARDAAQGFRDEARDHADRAHGEALKANVDAVEVAKQLEALYALSATAQGLPNGEPPTVSVTFVEGFANFLFGIPAGAQGEQGEMGPRGVGVSGVELVEGDHSPGTTDTYKITSEDGKEFLFYVTNGRNGARGPQGEPGRDGVAVEASGQYFFQIESGDLWVYYTGEEAPAFSLEDDGNLYLEVSA